MQPVARRRRRQPSLASGQPHSKVLKLKELMPISASVFLYSRLKRPHHLFWKVRQAAVIILPHLKDFSIFMNNYSNL